MSSTQSTLRLCLPGFGRPVNFLPNRGDAKYNAGLAYPNAVLNWHVDAMTVRERNMLEVMNQLTDKNGWEVKVFDETIVEKWRKEAVCEPPKLTSWGRATFTNDQGFDDDMFNYCIEELRVKAAMYKSSNIIRIFDNAATVVKSDTLISSDLKMELRKVVAELLEDVPDHLKDWHPGSNEQVLDLVHPSLFPLVYGRTRILPESVIGVEGSLQSGGSGEIIPVPPASEGTESEYDSNKVQPHPTKLWSTKFQWLPCDVSFTDGGVKIESYINNLHPVTHKALYPLIEQVMNAALPMWDDLLGYIGTDLFKRREYNRIDGAGVDYEYTEDEDEENKENDEDEDEDEDDDEDEDRDKNRTLIFPGPSPFSSEGPPGERVSQSHQNHLRTTFSAKGLQIIVKLANIILTPDKPEYPGGSWHVEGQLNEHICATAIYYYDSENVTDSYLGFRQKVDTYGPEEHTAGQDDYGGLEFILDITQHEPAVQDIGKVKTSEGRLIAFPNVMQHRVLPFSLQDKTKPGHRKIIALFLVDPHIRVTSTANVPPQNKDWWLKDFRHGAGMKILPEELKSIIEKDVDWLMTMEEAKVLREELMEERKAYIPAVQNSVYAQEFSFCEH